MTKLERLKAYARLLVETALALKAGQYLYIEASLEAEDFVALVAETALERGAADVSVRWMSDQVNRARMSGPDCGLGTAEAEQLQADWMIDHGAALLRLESPNLTAFSGVDAARLQQRAGLEAALHRGFRTRGKAQNVIACAATPSWARSVFPELPQEEGLERLWDCVLGSVMADTPDPVQAWKTVISQTDRRRQVLNQKGYTQLHITGKGTDLHLEMPETREWAGGGMTMPDGLFFMPNLPSYEVFSSPKAAGVEGCVTATLPLNHHGGIIRDIYLRFHEGKVVEYRASEGEELLREILETDENSDRLGEVAIVEHGSPVHRQGIIFYTTVCDENAACHLALGNGFCMQGPEEARRRGINTSNVHVDFMIGAADTCIRGRCGDGPWEDILVNGTWTIN